MESVLHAYERGHLLKIGFTYAQNLTVPKTNYSRVTELNKSRDLINYYFKM